MGGGPPHGKVRENAYLSPKKNAPEGRVRVSDDLCGSPAGDHRHLADYLAGGREKSLAEIGEGEGLTPANRKEVRRASIRRWQHEWDETMEVAAWTRSLIPNISNWLECKHKTLSYEVTQILTDHGCFMSYTYRIGKEEAPTCVYCVDGTEDTVEHTISSCGRWEEFRVPLIQRVGAFDTTKDLIDKMIRSKEVWEAARKYITEVITTKEEEERRRQRQDQYEEEGNSD